MPVNPEAIEPVLRFARSLGFGATVGVCCGIIAQHYFPQLPLTRGDLMYVGAGVGALLHRVLDWWMSRLLTPMSDVVRFYTDLLQLRLLKGVLTEAQRKQIKQQLAKDYFSRPRRRC